VHPTQKPVALWTQILEWRTTRGERILDPYAGSGSLLIAAEQAERIALLSEISAAYCDVICRRYQDYTGTKPERIREDGTTEPVSFTSD